MGQIIKVHCKCGFDSQIILGGSRNSYLEDSSYPYYCKNCGLVSANMASCRDDFDKPMNCPICKSDEIIPYGTNELSSTKIENEIKPDITKHKENNFCPDCKDYSLVIGPLISLFD